MNCNWDEDYEILAVLEVSNDIFAVDQKSGGRGRFVGMDTLEWMLDIILECAISEISMLFSAI